MKQIYYPKSNEEICKAVSVLRDAPFLVQGTGNSWLTKKQAESTDAKRVLNLKKFNQILRFDGVKGEITVQAGCTLAKINEYLNERGYVLASCPDYFGVSAGACAATPVHGYSRQHQCLAALMSRLKVLLIETGDVIDIVNTDKDWSNVFFGRMAGVVYLEVTFDCVPTTTQFLSVRVENDDQLKSILSLGTSEQQIITWYPVTRKVTEISLRPLPTLGVNYRRVTRAVNLYRNLGYGWFLLQLVLKRARHLTGPANLLAPGFRDLNAAERAFISSGKAVDVELSMRIEDVWRFIEIVNALSMTERKFCVGFRWGGIAAHINQRVWDPSADIWVEMVGDESKIRHVISRLKKGTYAFHTGKYIPVME